MSIYRLEVAGPDGGSFGEVELDCDSDTQAIRVAALALSPHGHSLWCGRHLLGWFDPPTEKKPAPDKP